MCYDIYTHNDRYFFGFLGAVFVWWPLQTLLWSSPCTKPLVHGELDIYDRRTKNINNPNYQFSLCFAAFFPQNICCSVQSENSGGVKHLQDTVTSRGSKQRSDLWVINLGHWQWPGPNKLSEEEKRRRRREGEKGKELYRIMQIWICGRCKTGGAGQ